MRICVVGTGYVGLVTGVCLAEIGNQVWCVDSDRAKVSNLAAGIMPIYEPGLEEMVCRNASQGRLIFTDELSEGIKQAAIVFIAVGTPSHRDGSVDLSSVFAVADNIGKYMDEYRLIVLKSTVPVGTTAEVAKRISARIEWRRKESLDWDMVFCPEFLKEGSAIADFMKPDRIIVGADRFKPIEMLRELFAPYLARENQEARFLSMSIVSAELTKYAANAMLATRISFMNELVGYCESTGADIEHVRRGIGADSRIGSAFLYAGAGYGGSCFPKDVKALISSARNCGCELSILTAVEAVNNKQKHVLFQKIKSRFGEQLVGYTFAIWGLSYKPKTDDIREAPSLALIKSLLDAGARVCAYDPVAVEKVKQYFSNHLLAKQLIFAEDPYTALKDCDALALVTEWAMFRRPDFEKIKSEMKRSIIFDGRNLYDAQNLHNLGIEYHALGRPTANTNRFGGL